MQKTTKTTNKKQKQSNKTNCVQYGGNACPIISMSC